MLELVAEAIEGSMQSSRAEGGGEKGERHAGQMAGQMNELQPVDPYQFRHRLELGVAGDNRRVVSESDGDGEGVCIGERITRF